jgi:hypothetical protein
MGGEPTGRLPSLVMQAIISVEHWDDLKRPSLAEEPFRWST